MTYVNIYIFLAKTERLAPQGAPMAALLCALGGTAAAAAAAARARKVENVVNSL